MHANPCLILLAVALTSAVGCTEPDAPIDAAGIDAAAQLRVLLASRPLLGCDRVELHLTVSGAEPFNGLGAGAFEFSLVDPDGGARTVPNECFEAATADGGAFFYRVCVSGLSSDTPYFFGMHVTTPAGDVNESTYFRTASCDDGSVDARVDATVSDAVDSGIDGTISDVTDSGAMDATVGD